MKHQTFRKTDLAYFHERNAPVDFIVDYEFPIPRTPQTFILLYYIAYKKATSKLCQNRLMRFSVLNYHKQSVDNVL